MTDPPRWLEDADAPHGAASLLRSARASKPLDVAVQARSAARVAELAAQGAATTTAAGSLSASLFTKVIVGLAAVALVGGAVVAMRPAPASVASPRASAVRVVAPTPVVAAHVPRVEVVTSAIVAPRATAPAAPRAMRAPRVVEAPRAIEPEVTLAPVANVIAPTPVSEAPEVHPVGGGVVGGAPPASRATLLEETQALAAVSTVMESDPSEAQRRLDAYRERFPRSRLAPERDYLAFEAARRRGDASEVRSLGEAFLRAHPRSPHASAVRARIAP